MNKVKELKRYNSNRINSNNCSFIDISRGGNIVYC